MTIRPPPGPRWAASWCHGRRSPGPASDGGCRRRCPASSVAHFRRASAMYLHIRSWLRGMKKCCFFPIREALRPRRRKSPPAKPRVRLWLEEVESRTVPTTLTRPSAPTFSNDFSASGATLTSAYASYRITNTDGVNYADVWATIGNFTSASGPVVVTLGTNAAGAIDLGPLANGQTKTAFFYLRSNAVT